MLIKALKPYWILVKDYILEGNTEISPSPELLLLMEPVQWNVFFVSQFFGFLQFFFRHFTRDNFSVANSNSSTDSRTSFMEEQAASVPCLYNILGLMKECSASKTLGKICYNFPALVRESLCFLHRNILLSSSSTQVSHFS
jgi:hypothetical protein